MNDRNAVQVRQPSVRRGAIRSTIDSALTNAHAPCNINCNLEAIVPWRQRLLSEEVTEVAAGEELSNHIEAVLGAATCAHVETQLGVPQTA